MIFEESIKVDFTTVSGEAYTNESYSFGDYITVSTHNNGCYFNNHLRLYESDSYNGYAVIASTNVVSSLVINAGYNDSTLEVYGSTDGSTWELIQSFSTSASYAEHTVDLDKTLEYKFIKLDAIGAQIRVLEINVTIVK